MKAFIERWLSRNAVIRKREEWFEFKDGRNVLVREGRSSTYRIHKLFGVEFKQLIHRIY